MGGNDSTFQRLNNSTKKGYNICTATPVNWFATLVYRKNSDFPALTFVLYVFEKTPAFFPEGRTNQSDSFFNDRLIYRLTPN